MADRNIDDRMAVRAFNIVGHFHSFRHSCVFHDFVKRRFVDLNFHSQLITYFLPHCSTGKEGEQAKEMNSVCQSKNVRPRGTDSAKVIQVIEKISLRGIGTDTDPVRAVKQFWNFEGELLAESDPFICEE